MSKQIDKLTTEISHTELIHALSPLLDVSVTLDRLTEKAASDNADDIFGIMDANVKQAMEPLKASIERIEKENPDQFS